MVESGGSVPICKTEVIDNNLNPKWKPVCLNFQQFGSKVSLTSLNTTCLMSNVKSYIDYNNIRGYFLCTVVTLSINHNSNIFNNPTI